MTVKQYIDNKHIIYRFYTPEQMKGYLEEYAQEVLKIAVKTAKIKRNYYPNKEQLKSQTEATEFYDNEYNYFISEESILNCLKNINI